MTPSSTLLRSSMKLNAVKVDMQHWNIPYMQRRKGSRAWKTKSFSRMQGYDTPVDQCAYGLELPGDDGWWYPAKKPTTFRTTKRSLYEGLARSCCGCSYHVPIEGYAKGYGYRSQMAESYPDRLAKRLGDLLAAEPQDCDDDYIMAVDEHTAELLEEEGRQMEVLRSADDDIIKLNKELEGSWPTSLQLHQAIAQIPWTSSTTSSHEDVAGGSGD